jgi:predicted HD superfamily hydrolase involved in NAD metabolism
MEDRLPPALAEALGRLPDGLRAHLLRTQALARDLAGAWGLDTHKAALAALTHDLCRADPPALLLEEARRLGLPIHPVEEAVPLLLHGPVAAARLRALGITDPEVLDAVRWHSTAHPSLSPVGKVVFLADKVDEGKGVDTDPTLQEVRRLLYRDLDGALLLYLGRQMARLLEATGLLHPATVETWNALLLRRRGGQRTLSGGPTG